MVKKTNILEKPNISINDQYIIKTKFQDRALIPQEAIDSNWFKLHCFNSLDQKLKDSAVFITTDGHKVHIKPIGCCNNSKGDEIEWLQAVSEKAYGLKFETLQSHWFARLGDLSGYWHLIGMEEIK